MKFNDLKISKEQRFSIGIEETLGKHYLSIPMSGFYVDYEEYYEITQDSFESFMNNMDTAKNFVEACRRRENDKLLIQKPRKYRGDPI